jgi:tetratricopeptide (TPR) repeat protein
MLLRNVGAHPLALVAFETAIKHSPDYAKPHYEMALVYLQTNRLEEAREACESALRINPYMLQARRLQKRLGR